MREFDELGSQVERSWRQRKYSELEFTNAALDALEEIRPSEITDFTSIVTWAMGAETLPVQHDIGSDFGQPPLTLYWGRDFRIEALFWTVGLPGIHHHAFSGAFHVLHGSSMHATYHFDLGTRLTGRLSIGHLHPLTVENLPAGSTRPIISGPSQIHATFHLDRPSVTIVVRTNREQWSLPQCVYLPPSIAYDPNEIPDSIRRQYQLLYMLFVCERGDLACRLFDTICMKHDIFAIFFCLWNLCMDVGKKTRAVLLEKAANIDAQLIEALLPALNVRDMKNQLQKLRRKLRDPKLQFFLAVLLNIETKPLMLDVIRDRYPDIDPSQYFRECSSAVQNTLVIAGETPEPQLSVALEM